MTKKTALRPLHSRMARVALGLGVRELAEVAEVSTNTVVRFERGDEDLKEKTIEILRTALEKAGAEILYEDEHGGDGVRLKLKHKRRKSKAAGA